MAILRIDRPSVRQISDGSWLLLEPFRYIDEDVDITIPQGFPTDFSSIPSRVRSLAPPRETVVRSGLVHDFLCRQPPFTKANRARADRVWRRLTYHDIRQQRGFLWRTRRAINLSLASAAWAVLRVVGNASYGENNPHVTEEDS